MAIDPADIQSVTFPDGRTFPLKGLRVRHGPGLVCFLSHDDDPRETEVPLPYVPLTWGPSEPSSTPQEPSEGQR